MPTSSRTIESTDGVTLAVHELGGEGPTVLFCHATGMHGRVWGPVAAALVDRYRCVAVDFRGHGDSTLPDHGSQAWDGMAHDVLAVVDDLGGGPLRAVGWSMGGCAITLAGVARPGLWAGIWAMEPIIFGNTDAPVSIVDGENRLAIAARKRREVFASRQAALDNYASKPPFAAARPDALAAYVEHGFEDLADGTVRLKCRGETEARTFEMSATGAGDVLDQLDVPFTVVASGDGMPPAQIAPWVAEKLPRGRLECMDDLTHFAPMEDPARVAASIAETLG